MKIAEYKQIGSHKEQRIVRHDAVYDEFTGMIIEDSRDEVVEVDIPEMGLVYRDATPEEESEAARVAEEAAEIEANREPTTQEQIDDLYDLVSVLTEVVANG